MGRLGRERAVARKCCTAGETKLRGVNSTVCSAVECLACQLWDVNEPKQPGRGYRKTAARTLLQCSKSDPMNSIAAIVGADEQAILVRCIPIFRKG